MSQSATLESWILKQSILKDSSLSLASQFYENIELDEQKLKLEEMEHSSSPDIFEIAKLQLSIGTN